MAVCVHHWGEGRHGDAACIVVVVVVAAVLVAVGGLVLWLCRCHDVVGSVVTVLNGTKMWNEYNMSVCTDVVQ